MPASTEEPRRAHIRLIALVMGRSDDGAGAKILMSYTVISDIDICSVMESPVVSSL